VITRYAYCHDERAKKAAHARARTLLRQVATHLGQTIQPGDVRTNPGGPIIWGESMLHTDKVYVQVEPSRDQVLVREVKGRTDYTGSHNRYIPLSLLSHPKEFAARVAEVTGCLR